MLTARPTAMATWKWEIIKIRPFRLQKYIFAFSYKRSQDEENVEVMLGKGEQRNAYVAEDEILGQKIQQLKKLFCPVFRACWQIIERVVGLTNAAK